MCKECLYFDSTHVSVSGVGIEDKRKNSRQKEEKLASINTPAYIRGMEINNHQGTVKLEKR